MKRWISVALIVAILAEPGSAMGRVRPWLVLGGMVTVGVILWKVSGITGMPVPGRSYNDAQAERFVRQHADLSARYQEAILGHWLVIGMTEEMVRASWGSPDKVERWPGTWGLWGRWTYECKDSGDVVYVYFANGTLTIFRYE